MTHRETRADQLRLRVYKVLGHGGVKRIAQEIGKSPTYVANILNNYGTANPTLDAIEQRLNQLEAEQAQHA